MAASGGFALRAELDFPRHGFRVLGQVLELFAQVHLRRSLGLLVSQSQQDKEPQNAAGDPEFQWT